MRATRTRRCDANEEKAVANGSREQSKSGIEIRIDHDLCAGSGYCEKVCPEAFEIRDAKSWVRPADQWRALPREKLDEAGASCPWDAISVAVYEG
jgi:ferredoxin